MHVLIAIALKSLLIAGATLGLLALLRHRSAAERSWVAHIGLLALVIMAFAPLILPSWTVEAPALLGQDAAVPQLSVEAKVPAAAASPSTPAAAADAGVPAAPAFVSPEALATAAYAVPAALLLFVTLLALGRLIALRARADVLVDGHWLSALARAQRRMGFKHGTALLTSNDLASPISWGLMRPVILLNTRAVEASGEAEAIIAHELAHVARMDWAKLLLARVATALFWFNPFVWLLAREAHQLREEAADDAVLAADIVDTDYAQLLVGVARHECPGLLLGAHGVAPSKSSLARRVARVLDGSSVRGPAARSFAFGVFAGALLVAAPLAALTLTPGRSSEPAPATGAQAGKLSASEPSRYYPEPAQPTDLGSIIAEGVSTSVATAVAAVGPLTEDQIDAREEALEAAAEAREDAAEARQDAIERSREAAAQAREAARVAHRVQARQKSAIDRAIELKAVGVTPEYVTAMIGVAPQLARLDPSDFVAMKAVGVTPDFAREWTAAGFRHIDDGDLTSARAVGLRGSYVREMMAAGVRTTFDDYIQLWTVGVRPDYVRKMRAAGYVFRDADQLVEMQALGLGPRDLNLIPPKPPRPARPPRAPTVYPDRDPDGG